MILINHVYFDVPCQRFFYLKLMVLHIVSIETAASVPLSAVRHKHDRSVVSGNFIAKQFPESALNCYGTKTGIDKPRSDSIPKAH